MNDTFGKIIWKRYLATHDDFGNPLKQEYCWCEGWGPEDKPGIQNTYAGAVAANMNLWDEYCEYWRTND